MENNDKERKLRPRRPRIQGARPGGSRESFHGGYQQRSRGAHDGEEGQRPARRYSDSSRNYDRKPARAYGESRGERPARRRGDDEAWNNDSPRPRYRSEGASRFKSEGGPARRGGDRPFAGKKGPAARQSFKPRKKDGATEGIERMVSRKPQVDQLQYSDNDNVRTPISEVVRLNKFIANSGVCSRREADQMIQAGVVSINGEVVTELGTKVNVLTDEVRFNGEPIHGEEKVYIVMNKPKGYVTTAGDPHAEKTVMDLLKGCPSRVFPVGRLDKNTTGVLMFTNDGEIAERLTHPSYDKKKIYQVTLDHPLSEEDFRTVLEGIELGDGMIRADELEYIDAEDHRKLGIEIHSGKNRIVRRIFESLGYDVKALDRVYFAGLTKKGVKKGEWRYLSKGEANVLKMGAYV